MPKTTVRMAASQSFKEDEVKLLTQVFSALMRGGDVSSIIRTKAFASCYRKVAKMRDRLEEQAALSKKLQNEEAQDQ